MDSMKFQDTPYAQGKAIAKVEFAEVFCTSKQTIFENRVAEASKSGATLEDPEVRELIHAYLSFYRYHAKYQMLLMYQLTLWKSQKVVLDADFGTDAESQTKAVALLDKMTDLTWKLQGKVSGLLSEIYGANEVQEIAQEQIVKVMSPEARMKRKRKSTEESPMDV